jgi:hypothetical protein
LCRAPLTSGDPRAAITAAMNAVEVDRHEVVRVTARAVVYIAPDTLLLGECRERPPGLLDLDVAKPR